MNFIKKLLGIEQQLLGIEQSTNDNTNHRENNMRETFHHLYFDGIISIDLESDGSGTIGLTDKGIEFFNRIETAELIISAINGFLMAYKPDRTIRYGVVVLTQLYEVLAFKKLMQEYNRKLQLILRGEHSIIVQDDIESLSGNGGENKENAQIGRTARVMNELNQMT